MAHQTIPVNYNGLTVVMVDSGQGDTTLIRYPTGEILVVDCGSTKVYKGAVAAAVKTVIDAFTTAHNNTIDWLVLTHPDEDHYSMVLPAIINNGTNGIAVDRVFFGGDAKDYKARGCDISGWLSGTPVNGNTPAQIENLQPNQSIGTRTPRKRKTTGNVGGYSDLIHQTGQPDRSNHHLSTSSVKAWILAANVGTAPNPKSIVLLLQYREIKILLMGDATKETEDFILETFDSPTLATARQGNSTLNNLLSGSTSDVVLKLGHHGSDTSSGHDWITQLEPEVLLVSAAPQGFGSAGTGMPRRSIIDDASGHVASGATAHSYVVFENRVSHTRGFETISRSTQWIFSTTSALGDPNSATNPDDAGVSVYYMIPATGNPPQAEVHMTPD